MNEYIGETTCRPNNHNLGKNDSYQKMKLKNWLQCSLQGCPTSGTKKLLHDFSLSSEESNDEKEQKPRTQATVPPGVTQIEIESFVWLFYERKYISLTFDFLTL